MRVTKKQINIIKTILSKQIDDAKIYLFGSRVDDKKKGGDIDIFVKTSHPVSLKDEIAILTQLELEGIERKVDLVIDSKGKDMSAFFTSIQKKAKAL
jgi:predicted nucleotidyltransferase